MQVVGNETQTDRPFAEERGQNSIREERIATLAARTSQQEGLSDPVFDRHVELIAGKVERKTGSGCICPHIPHAFGKEQHYLINTPVLSLHEACDSESSFVSQSIYGHSVYVLETMDETWVQVETEEGYVGYARQDQLAKDNPSFRYSEALRPTKSQKAWVYRDPDLTKRAPLMGLPFGSRVKVIEEEGDRWRKIQFVDGSEGWIQEGDLGFFETGDLQAVLELAKGFQGLPYTWGGTSSFGFDCSGYVHTVFKLMGMVLPRDSRPQNAYCFLEEVGKVPERPGDLVFFGEERVSHIGIYLGEGEMIHTGVRNQSPKTCVVEVESSNYQIYGVKRVRPIVYEGKIFQIDEKIQAKMGHSWKENNPVLIKDLRYVTLRHFGFDGCAHDGALVVHKDVAEEVVEIFEELFEARYPVEKMLLIDAYEAEDDLSCDDNNSSAFCSRTVTGDPSRFSKHSYGKAIDLNPLINPYYNPMYREKEEVIGGEFLDRDQAIRGMIREGDACYQAFIKRGWRWGGEAFVDRNVLDYHHFEKD